MSQNKRSVLWGLLITLLIIYFLAKNCFPYMIEDLMGNYVFIKYEDGELSYYITTSDIEVSNDNTITGEFQNYTGSDRRGLNSQDPGSYELDFSVISEKGTLGIEVEEYETDAYGIKSQEIIVQLGANERTNITVHPGKHYSIDFLGSDFTGTFKLVCNKIEPQTPKE